MSRFGDAARALLGGQEREASLGSLLGDQSRVRRSTAPVISQETALKNSVWWGGLTLRADLMSTLPCDVLRPFEGRMVPVAKPGKFFQMPAPGVDVSEFLYSSSFDKDRYGNSIGIIRARNAFGKPAIVELQEMSNCRAQMSGGKIAQWRIGNDYYAPDDIWHERQFTVAGLELGLSPLAYAARSMSIYESAQDFALNWFLGGATPRGVLKNTKRDKIPANIREDAKNQFRAATEGGDIFVTGVEWEWTPASTDIATAGFLAQKANSEKDVARYVGVPAGMLDIDISTGNVTYANATQANLQLLVTKLGPAITRTERYWSRVACPNPWVFKMNTDALLRMDPAAKTENLVRLATARLRAPDELRALDNQAPYTAEQIAQIAQFAQFGKPPPATAGPAQKEASPWLVPS